VTTNRRHGTHPLKIIRREAITQTPRRTRHLFRPGHRKIDHTPADHTVIDTPIADRYSAPVPIMLARHTPDEADCLRLEALAVAVTPSISWLASGRRHVRDREQRTWVAPLRLRSRHVLYGCQVGR
jgi:hypothetical protein